MTTLAQMPLTGRRSAGIDYAKLTRWQVALDVKRASLQGLNQLLRGDSVHAGLVGDLDRVQLHIEVGMNDYGRSLWGGRDVADFLDVTPEDAENGRIDLAAVREYVALRERIAALTERANELHADIGPLLQIVKACETYLQIL